MGRDQSYGVSPAAATAKERRTSIAVPAFLPDLYFCGFVEYEFTMFERCFLKGKRTLHVCVWQEEEGNEHSSLQFIASPIPCNVRLFSPSQNVLSVSLSLSPVLRAAVIFRSEQQKEERGRQSKRRGRKKTCCAF